MGVLLTLQLPACYLTERAGEQLVQGVDDALPFVPQRTRRVGEYRERYRGHFQWLQHDALAGDDEFGGEAGGGRGVRGGDDQRYDDAAGEASKIFDWTTTT